MKRCSPWETKNGNQTTLIYLLAMWKKQIFQSIRRSPQTRNFFGRYIDDCFGGHILHQRRIGKRFIGFCQLFPSGPSNSHAKSLKPFLDINISVQDNKIGKPVSHCKPTDSHSYLLYSSFPPISRPKDSIPLLPIFSGLRRLCSEDSDFNSKCGRNV